MSKRLLLSLYKIGNTFLAKHFEGNVMLLKTLQPRLCRMAHLGHWIQPLKSPLICYRAMRLFIISLAVLFRIGRFYILLVFNLQFN